jgi:hypothetical protein
VHASLARHPLQRTRLTAAARTRTPSPVLACPRSHACTGPPSQQTPSTPQLCQPFAPAVGTIVQPAPPCETFLLQTRLPTPHPTHAPGPRTAQPPRPAIHSLACPPLTVLRHPGPCRRAACPCCLGSSTPAPPQQTPLIGAAVTACQASARQSPPSLGILFSGGMQALGAHPCTHRPSLETLCNPPWGTPSRAPPFTHLKDSGQMDQRRICRRPQPAPPLATLLRSASVPPRY